MAVRSIGWAVGLAWVAGTASVAALADGGPLELYNPLGVYVGAGLGRATLNDAGFDSFDYYDHYDGQPLGWEALVGIRPIPFLGAEAEYIDFGSTHLGYGPSYYSGGYAQQFQGGDTHDRAAAIFAVGYLPVPIPWIEPFGKLGFGQIWQHNTFDGIYNGVASSGSQTTHPSGAAYGGGVQFHIQQFAVRAQYERISGDRSLGGWDNPSLWSVGVNWTF
jgi:hypothetical protein